MMMMIIMIIMIIIITMINNSSKQVQIWQTADGYFSCTHESFLYLMTRHQVTCRARRRLEAG
jgi:hypothetical protein